MSDPQPAPAAPPPPARPALRAIACPRCGGDFRCGAAGPGPCACSGLTLTPALQAALRARWDDCLCLDCLRTLADGAPLEPATVTGPATPPPPPRG
jgi:hypothetical protein